MTKAEEIIALLKEMEEWGLRIDHKCPDVKWFVYNKTRSIQTIAAKVADGIGKPAGEIRIDMITEIVDVGRAGIVPRTHFELFERNVKVSNYDKLEDAVNEYNGRTGE